MPLAIQNLQPAGYLYAAYQPVPFRVYLDYQPGVTQPAIPPVVYCDIYISGKYYRTLSSTVYGFAAVAYLVGFPRPSLTQQQRPAWTFDISDALQEYLRTTTPDLTPYITQDSSMVATVQVAFRGSSVNANGLTVVDGPAPVQGDFYKAPQAGGGVMSAVYIALNSTLQPEDNPSLAAHLASFRGYASAGYKIDTLSHRPSGAYYACAGQYDFTKIYVQRGGLNGLGDVQANLAISGKLRSGVTFLAVATAGGTVTLAEGCVYNLATGPAQLSQLSWSTPIDWAQVTEYQLFLYSGSVITAVWTGPRTLATGCCPGGARIHFLNALGGWDAVNFQERTESQTTKSGSWQRSAPLLPGTKRDSGGLQRFAVRASREGAVRTIAFPENAQSWLAELARSPRAFLEWPGTQGQPADLLPIRIMDGKLVTRKSTERYVYELEIAYELADEAKTHRS